MRISTNTIFELGSGRLADLQSNLVKTQQQLSTQRRILTPADDPVGAAAALRVTQSLSINEQFSVNRQNAKSALSESETVLQGVTSLLQDAKMLVVNAGNGAMEDQQRKFLAAELRGRLDELMGFANSRNGSGDFMFGGFQISSQPFSQVAGGARYNGDQGQRMLQIGPSRQIALNDSGSAVFERNRTGNGTFVTAADDNNKGSGIVGTGAVVDGTKLTADKYSLEFTVTPGAPGAPPNATYRVKIDGTTRYLDPATGVFATPTLPALPAEIPYVSGEAITFDGIQFDIKGAPANNDVFTVQPSANKSIFETMSDLISALGVSGAGAPGQARLTNELSTANNNIDRSLDNLLDVRASVGTRLKELDVLDNTGMDLNIQYTETLRNLQEIDLTETISSFTQQQITLEAAQKSFMTISRLSLFSHI